MKKFMLFILFSLSFNFAFSQIKVIQKDNKTFVAVLSSKTAKPTDFSYVDKDGKIHQVYITAKGKYFVNKTSKKTGKVYRAYITISSK